MQAAENVFRNMCVLWGLGYSHQEGNFSWEIANGADRVGLCTWKHCQVKELTDALFTLYLKITSGIGKKERQAMQTEAENINGRTRAIVSNIWLVIFNLQRTSGHIISWLP